MASIEYRIMKPNDSEQVRELFYEYWKSEPLAMALKVEVPRECKRYVDYALEEGLHNGLSIVAVEIKDNTIIGFGICVLSTPDKRNNWDYPAEDKDCEKLTSHNKISRRLYDGLDVFTSYGVDKICESIALCIRPDYARAGLATKLFAERLRLLREYGIKLYVSEATSYFSRRVLEKLGCEIIREVKYDEYIADGTLEFPPNSPHKSIVLAVKIIKPDVTGTPTRSTSSL